MERATNATSSANANTFTSPTMSLSARSAKLAKLKADPLDGHPCGTPHSTTTEFAGDGTACPIVVVYGE